ncbi:hypothetical protein [Olivibacter jilunii]|uniref:hypothetical protein n=1 Tax=Olivibacter jilunii TaxID=985016 RepID=UPI00102FE323|nr:hypothetical protein [Olivibacter jilunii]
MKITYLITGLLIGGILSFFLAKSFYQTDAQTDLVNSGTESDTAFVESKWNVPNDVDAVKAAPESHKIVYEDSSVRILRVILEPNKTEPVHTHRWKSIMWFSQATPMTYYKYVLKDNGYMIQDSIAIAQMPPEVLNHGEIMGAEGPHAIKNLGSREGVAYRVEFKKEFKP